MEPLRRQHTSADVLENLPYNAGSVACLGVDGLGWIQQADHSGLAGRRPRVRADRSAYLVNAGAWRQGFELVALWRHLPMGRREQANRIDVVSRRGIQRDAAEFCRRSRYSADQVRLSQRHIYRQAGVQRAAKHLGLGLSLCRHGRADEQGMGGMAGRSASERSL